MKSDLPIFVSAAADDAGLSVHAFRVLARICRRWSERDGCYESGAKMAKACRIKRDSVFRALNELEDRGMIRRTERAGQTSRIDPLPVENWTPPVPPNGTGTRPPKRDSPNEGVSPQTGHPPVPPNGTPPVPPNGTQRDTSKGTLEGKPNRARGGAFEHPAVIAYADVTGKPPPMAHADAIATALPRPTPDTLRQWTEHVTTWDVTPKWNVRNVPSMLQAFSEHRSRSAGKASTVATTLADASDLI